MGVLSGSLRRQAPALAFQLKVNDPATDWRVAPMPAEQSGGKAVNYAGGSSLVIPSTSRYPKQALDFMLWLTSKEGQDLKFGVDKSLNLSTNDISAQGVPANKQVGATLLKDKAWTQAVATMNVPTRASGVSPIYSKAYDILAAVEQNIILKHSDVRTELAAAQQKVQALIDQSMQKNPELYK